MTTVYKPIVYIVWFLFNHWIYTLRWEGSKGQVNFSIYKPYLVHWIIDLYFFSLSYLRITKIPCSGLERADWCSYGSNHRIVYVQILLWLLIRKMFGDHIPKWYCPLLNTVYIFSIGLIHMMWCQVDTIPNNCTFLRYMYIAMVSRCCQSIRDNYLRWKIYPCNL